MNPLRRTVSLPATLPLVLPIGALVTAGGAACALRGPYRVAVVLGLTQGVGEFVPISSSAHLLLLRHVLGWTGEEYASFNSQSFDVALHIGTLLALAVTLWPDWMRLLRHATLPHSPEGRLFWLLVLASLPAAALGALLETDVPAAEEQLELTALLLAAMGVLLFLADHLAPAVHKLDDLRWEQALAIGVAQACALLPGVSRAGATISMGRALGFERETAARFSFLLATPITLGAGLLKLRRVRKADLAPAVGVGIGVAFGVGLSTMSLLLRFLHRPGASFMPFAVYRVFAGAWIVGRSRRSDPVGP